MFVNQLLPALIGGDEQLDRVSASPARHDRPRMGTYIPTRLRRRGLRTWGNRRSGRVRPTSLKLVRFIPHREKGKRSSATCGVGAPAAIRTIFPDIIGEAGKCHFQDIDSLLPGI